MSLYLRDIRIPGFCLCIDHPELQPAKFCSRMAARRQTFSNLFADTSSPELAAHFNQLVQCITVSYRLMGARYPEPQTRGRCCRLQLCPPHLARALPPPSPTGHGSLPRPPGQTLLAALGRASPQAVLQQLVGAGRAGTRHQAHGGLVEEDLEGKAEDQG